MFLSKRGGIYYLFFDDEHGRRVSRSTVARGSRRGAIQSIFEVPQGKQSGIYLWSVTSPEGELVGCEPPVGGDYLGRTRGHQLAMRVLASQAGNVT